jgi:hypothetical protein
MTPLMKKQRKIQGDLWFFPRVKGSLTSVFYAREIEYFRNYSAGVGQSPSSPASKSGEIPISPDNPNG